MKKYVMVWGALLFGISALAADPQFKLPDSFTCKRVLCIHGTCNLPTKNFQVTGVNSAENAQFNGEPADVTTSRDSDGKVSDSAMVNFEMALGESEPFRDAQFYAWDLSDFAFGEKKAFFGTYTSGYSWDDTYTEEVAVVRCAK